MTYFGFMHGEEIGVGQSPAVALSYLGVAAVLYGCAKFATVSPPAAEHSEAGHHEGAIPSPAE